MKITHDQLREAGIEISILGRDMTGKCVKHVVAGLPRRSRGGVARTPFEEEHIDLDFEVWIHPTSSQDTGRDDLRDSIRTITKDAGTQSLLTEMLWGDIEGIAKRYKLLQFFANILNINLEMDC